MSRNKSHSVLGRLLAPSSSLVKKYASKWLRSITRTRAKIVLHGKYREGSPKDALYHSRNRRCHAKGIDAGAVRTSCGHTTNTNRHNRQTDAHTHAPTAVSRPEMKRASNTWFFCFSSSHKRFPSSRVEDYFASICLFLPAEHCSECPATAVTVALTSRDGAYVPQPLPLVFSVSRALLFVAVISG